MKKKESVLRPSRFWTGFVYCLLWPTIKRKYDLHINKDDIKDVKGPYVLVCNHAMEMDPYFVYGAIFPELVNFVGGYNHFNNKLFKFFLKQMGAIPKFQYQTDLKAMKDMLTVIKRGDNLGIFPAGRNSSCGEGFYIPDALAKLLKMCKAQVLTCHIDGSYLVKPKWAKERRKGPIFITFEKCLTKDEVISKSDKEITEIINKELAFNDYIFNKEKKYHYQGNNFALGLETTCYKCPKCGKEYSLFSDGNHLKCSCGLDLELEDTGYFKENKYFSNPNEWYEWQRKELHSELNKDIILEDGCIIRMNLKDGLTDVGEGVVKITPKDIIFKGVINNEDKELIFPLEDLMSLPYRAGENFEIADSTNIYQFKLNNGLSATKWSLVVEELYKLNS